MKAIKMLLDDYFYAWKYDIIPVTAIHFFCGMVILAVILSPEILLGILSLFVGFLIIVAIGAIPVLVLTYLINRNIYKL